MTFSTLNLLIQSFDLGRPQPRAFTGSGVQTLIAVFWSKNNKNGYQRMDGKNSALLPTHGIVWSAWLICVLWFNGTAFHCAFSYVREGDTRTTLPIFQDSFYRAARCLSSLIYFAIVYAVAAAHIRCSGIGMCGVQRNPVSYRSAVLPTERKHGKVILLVIVFIQIHPFFYGIVWSLFNVVLCRNNDSALESIWTTRKGFLCSTRFVFYTESGDGGGSSNEWRFANAHIQTSNVI